MSACVCECNEQIAVSKLDGMIIIKNIKSASHYGLRWLHCEKNNYIERDEKGFRHSIFCVNLTLPFVHIYLLNFLDLRMKKSK